jgi:hypothetical protein
MLGRPLPESGRLVVRVDADGNASTQAAEDLSAEVKARAGQPVRLVLSR